uniref:Uncharacterized protein n=1 Tax=Hucho hucho TaxID=62062 RepID=A0A4W5LSP9_9TELE
YNLHLLSIPFAQQHVKFHYSGLEEAVFRNIQACKELAQTTRTAYGPNGETTCKDPMSGSASLALPACLTLS